MTEPAADEHLDLDDRIAAAKAMNRLSHALVRHRADPRVLRTIAVEAERLAEALEHEPVRERRVELVSSPRFEEALKNGPAILRAEGAFVDMFDDSPVSGSANPLNMGLKVARDGDEAVGRITLGPGWQGAPERAHGGIVAAVVDEVLGAMLPILETVAFTGELTCRYAGPMPVGVETEFRARSVGREGRKLYLECVGSSDAGEFVRARATFISIDLQQFQAGTA